MAVTTALDEAISNLRALNEPVPTPLRLPTESEVREAERRAGGRFHQDLRRYLLGASDVVYGTLEPVTIVGGGHTAFVDVLKRARRWGVPDDLIPVCEDNSDFYCIASSGEVLYWSHDGVADEKWPDLATWITDVWVGGN